MRVSFASESVVTDGRRLRQVDAATFSSLYQGLLWANGPEEYRMFSERIRAVAKKDAAPDFACLHPEWFSEEVVHEAEAEKIDNTVCTFCGYFQQCDKGNSEFFADVVFVRRKGAERRQTNLEVSIRKAFDFRDPSSDVAFSDPFGGFSRRANEPRTLYAIAYDDMQETLHDRFQGSDFAACVGYDLLTCQPLWPLDFILLSMVRDVDTWDTILLRSDRLKHQVNGLLVSDERFLEYYLELRRLELTDEHTRLLKEELSNMAGLVYAEATFHALRSRPFTPREDHPFERGSSTGLHILFRLFELMPSLLHSSRFEVAFPRFSSTMKAVLAESSPARPSIEQGKNQRLLPRFPAVLFLPTTTSFVHFDLPGCKIIYVVDDEVDRPMLLFDDLDFDVGLVRGWDLA